MKKLIFLFVMLQSIAFGQYKSLFGTTSTVWKIAEYYTWMSYENYQITVDPVFTINGETIYKLKNHLENCISYIKEDLVNGKFYYSSSSSGLYSLFMDLSLQLGDAFPQPIYFFEPSGHVDSIYYDTQNRKHIRFDSSCYPYSNYEFIEGVGTTRGIIRTCWGSGSNKPILICQEKNNAPAYSLNHPLVQNCHFNTLSLQEEETALFQTSPNPVTDQLNIILPEGKHILEAEILNALGQTVMSFKNIGAPLDVSGLESGVYFLRLKGENANYLRQVVKQ